MAIITNISPFTPESYPDIPHINGLSLQTFAAGFYNDKRDDILLMAFDKGSVAGGVTTQNHICGEPILWNRKYLPHDDFRAILVNAGNANVMANGAYIAEQSAQLCADYLSNSDDKILKEQILLASTGVIGQPLPIEKFKHSFRIEKSFNNTWFDAAKAIMTTDTFPKLAYRQIQLSQGMVTIAGIAKGSGMIMPNMATMLGFIVTDVQLTSQQCDEIIRQSVDKSFNSISVDSDTSTSDMAIFATTNQGIKICDSHDIILLQQASDDICLELAKYIIGDGEGISHRIKITVTGAQNNHDAKAIARAVANSPLVKTAFAGEDPNWGRISAAIGNANINISPSNLSITICNINIICNGPGPKNCSNPILTFEICCPTLPKNVNNSYELP